MTYQAMDCIELLPSSNLYLILDQLNDAKPHSTKALAQATHTEPPQVQAWLERLTGLYSVMQKNQDNTYQLLQPIHLLDLNQICHSMDNALSAPYNLKSYETIGSTHTTMKLKTPFKQLEVILSEHQAQGIGRYQRHWHNPFAQNMALTLGYPYEGDLSTLSPLGLAAGLSVVQTLHRCFPELPLKLKWPNDVLVNEKKICGILLETINIPDHSFPVLIMGIGLNTKGCPNDYPEDLQNIVTTIESEMSQISDIASKTETAPK